MNGHAVYRLTNRATIRAFLNRDRALTAYALGDLDDAFWPDSVFYGAQRGGMLESLVLLYHGLDPVVLTAFGEPDGVGAILDAVALPDEVYYLWLPAMEPLLAALFEQPHMHTEWRMVLDAPTFDAPPVDAVTRITPDQADLLAALYRHAADPGETIVAFSPWQIAHGVFYGVWVDGDLVATAGTHVWAPGEGVAAIGNVFTRPEFRGRGYASQCTAAVVTDALAAGIDPLVLNVRYGNEAAIHIYERLGFRRVATFLEGPGLRRIR